MKVHNLMEEFVTQIVNELYDNLVENKARWITCSCESCRLDAISYVLNRIPPHYIISGRGVVYTTQMLNDPQLKADVTALSMDAIRIISSVQRPYHKIASEAQQNLKPKDLKPSFNFPVFSGIVYNGSTFETMPNVKITLKDKENNIIAMQDFSWENPCKTFNSTKGSYSFWPKSIPAEEPNLTKKFQFIIEAQAEGYTPATCGFEIVLVSDEYQKVNIDQSLTLKLKDLFIF
jgi:competence protein ComFB